MNYLQKSTLILLTAVAPFLGLVTQVYAEEIVITGNGSESSNAASSNQSSSINVSQNNTATVENNVTINANTGNNTTSDNVGGDSSITTGDITISDEIANNLNSSSVQNNNCCGDQGKITISGNGAGSSNNASTNGISNTILATNNTATVLNSVKGNAATGNNTANGNNGNVKIVTGDILVRERITSNANTAFIKITSPLHKDYLLSISGNGSKSDNTITHTVTNEIVIAVNNNAEIFTNSFWDLITGNNQANDTSGDVTITTGNIDFESLITNNVNTSEVVVACCKDEKPEPIVPPEKPVQPKSDNNSVQGASASSGGSSNSTSGPSLPSTGNMWFFLALFGNLAALIYGTYLRLRSGRSPAYALA